MAPRTHASALSENELQAQLRKMSMEVKEKTDVGICNSDSNPTHAHKHPPESYHALIDTQGDFLLSEPSNPDLTVFLKANLLQP